MANRFVSIWLPRLRTDWFIRQQPALKERAFVLAAPDHGRMIVSAACRRAATEGIGPGMSVADARVFIPSLHVIDDPPGLGERLLHALALWCIRYAPLAAPDAPDGLLLDASGCAHLWKGEAAYLHDMEQRFDALGYTVRTAMADTPGAAWALARYSRAERIAPAGDGLPCLHPLPPAALRPEPATLDLLKKLGLKKLGDIIHLPRTALRRRFGAHLLQRIDEVTGRAEVHLPAVVPIEPYQERLPCFEPIITRTGVEIALERLLETLCQRLQEEGKGLRTCTLKGFCPDGHVESVSIGTSRPSHHVQHLFRLFTICLDRMDPAAGIELFLLEAGKVEDATPAQDQLWTEVKGLGDPALAELLDRIAVRFGHNIIRRYLPEEHYWPEHAARPAATLDEQPASPWPADKPRPMQLLPTPAPIDVTAPIPDYPPMLFRHRGQLHKIVRADGPERIEQEWWLQQGEHRDYYNVEDEEGRRYWIFRLGHYTGDKGQQWFLHGYFA